MELLAKAKPFDRLQSHLLKYIFAFHIVNHKEYLWGSLKPDLTYIVIAEFERDGEDILEDNLGVIDFR